MRVLYVDDEPDLLELGKTFLESSRELTVDTAISAADARRMLASNAYEAIISDYHMPDMDGLQLLKALRAENNHVPFIIFTGKGREEVVIEALNSGADFYLQKGGNPQAQFAELEQKVKEAVRRSRAEEGICRSEGRFRTLFENMLNGFAYCQMIYDEEGRPVDYIYLEVNKAFSRLTGLDGVKGKRASTVFPEMLATESELMETYGRVANGGPPEIKVLFFKPLAMWFNISIFCPGPGLFITVFENITERNLAQERTEENERRLKAHVENSPMAVVEWDADFIITRWAGEAEAIFGYSASEMIGKRLTDLNLVYPEDIPLVQGVISRLTDGSVRYVISSNRNITKEGRIIHTTWYNTVLTDGNGKLSSVLSFALDNTARIETESELKDSERRLRTVLENSLDGINMLDLRTGRYVVLSPAQVEMTGMSIEELQGITAEQVYELTHPDDREITKNQQRRVLEGTDDGEPVEYRWLVKGEYRWFSDRRKIVKDEDGRPMAMVGISRDITEKKRVEEKIRRRDARFHLITENSPNHIVIMDKDLRYLWVLNPQLGLTLQDMIGKTDYDILPKEEAEALVAVKSEVLRSGKEMRFARSLMSKDGSMQHFDGMYKPTYDAQGRIDGLLGYFRNVTETVAVQNALREANRKMSILASITRHDIYNKLNVLEGYLDMLHSEVKDPALDPMFKKLKDTVGTIGSYTKFTKAYENVGMNEPKWQDLHELIEQALRKVPGGAIKIVNDVPPGKEAFLDPMAEKVVANLIDNVFRHGGKASQVRFSLATEQGSAIIVCEDDGVGIPEGMKDLMFTRAENSDHGLGLFLCREILGITGFNITENGSPGQGARFLISAPPGGIRDAVN